MNRNYRAVSITVEKLKTWKNKFWFSFFLQSDNYDSKFVVLIMTVLKQYQNNSILIQKKKKENDSISLNKVAYKYKKSSSKWDLCITVSIIHCIVIQYF